MSKSIVKAEKCYSAAARSGNISALTQLAFLYLDTPPPTVTPSQALSVLRMAASNGESRAATRWGHILLKGSPEYSVPANPSEALVWFEIGALNGWIPAMTQLAHCLENGIGCEVDLNKAIELYSKAALGGDDWAAQRLIVMVVHGGEGGVEAIEELGIVRGMVAPAA